MTSIAATNECIDYTNLACQQWQDHLRSNPLELIIQKSRPERPFQETTDLCLDAECTYGLATWSVGTVWI